MGTVLRRIERILFAGGALCLAYVGVTLMEAGYYRHAAGDLAGAVQAAAVGEPAVSPRLGDATAEADEVSIDPEPAAGDHRAVPAVSRTGAPAPAGLIGMLEIPHLRVSTAIVEGDTWQALRRGAGHLPGTALPGQPGNVVLAGHRDTVFRRLGQVDRGDRLRLTTPAGTFDYRVSRVFRVAPHEVWVMDRDAAALTLITCYPFTWTGSAPERWIVQAERQQH